MKHLRQYIRGILVEKQLRGQKDKRTLYHIGPRPPRPIPKMKWIEEWDAQAVDRDTGEKGDFVRVGADNSWQRYWLEQPVESGVFLTPNWRAISSFHGRIGNVYTFKVPEWVIKKAGGVHRYDHGSEVLISEEIWGEAGNEIEFLGKSVDESEVELEYEHSYSETAATVNRRGTPRSPSWLDTEELEAWKAKQKEFNLRGLRATKHPEDVIKLLKPDEVKAAIAAFEKKYPEALTGKKHEIEWEKDTRGGKGFPSMAQIAEPPISTKDEELIDLLKKRMDESTHGQLYSHSMTEYFYMNPGLLEEVVLRKAIRGTLKETTEYEDYERELGLRESVNYDDDSTSSEANLAMLVFRDEVDQALMMFEMLAPMNALDLDSLATELDNRLLAEWDKIPERPPSGTPTHAPELKEYTKLTDSWHWHILGPAMKFITGNYINRSFRPPENVYKLGSIKDTILMALKQTASIWRKKDEASP